MESSSLDDRVRFLRAIERAAPQVFAELRALGAGATHAGVARWAARWNLDGPGLEWLRAEALQAARKGFVGAPAIADFVLTHDLELSLSWEPAESGETRAQFLARARRELEAYADEVQDWARENAPSARRAERTTGQAEAGAARWDLLVSRLVLGSTFQAIGEEIGISWQGAREHVRRLAARLGVALP